jgi:hypothetical protein
LQNVDFEQVVKILYSPTKGERKKVYKESIDHKVIQTFGSTYHIGYSLFEAPYTVTNRAFLALRSVALLDDGSYIISIRSINRKDVPFDTNYVRGISNCDIHISLAEIEGNPNCVKIVSVDHIDPKGWIPTYIINSFKSRAGEFLNNIQNVCQLK